MAENVQNAENVVGDSEPQTEAVNASEQPVQGPPAEAVAEPAAPSGAEADEAEAEAAAPSEAEAEAVVTSVSEAETEAAASPENVAGAGVVAEPAAPSEPRKPKRSVSTRKLFAGAVALGVVGGVAGGFTIQAMRKPTPLPPLAVTQPVYPRSPIYDGTRPPALPASQDDAAIVNGDLTKLLLPTPADAKAGFVDHTWMSLKAEAETCADPASCFSSNVHDGVVRIADTSWKRSDGFYVEIRIIQHRPGYTDYANRGITDIDAGNHTKIRMPDGIASAGYEYFDENNENDDHAVAVHGDLAVYFWVTSAAQVPDPSIIDDLIKQQMARL